MGDLYREWNDFAEAERLLRQGLALVARVHWEPFMAQRYEFLARLALARMGAGDDGLPQLLAAPGLPDTSDGAMSHLKFYRQARAHYAGLML